MSALQRVRRLVSATTLGIRSVGHIIPMGAGGCTGILSGIYTSTQTAFVTTLICLSIPSVRLGVRRVRLLIGIHARSAQTALGQ